MFISLLVLKVVVIVSILHVVLSFTPRDDSFIPILKQPLQCRHIIFNVLPSSTSLIWKYILLNSEFDASNKVVGTGATE